MKLVGRNRSAKGRLSLRILRSGVFVDDLVILSGDIDCIVDFSDTVDEIDEGRVVLIGEGVNCWICCSKCGLFKGVSSI